MAKTVKVATKKVSMKGVHGKLASAIAQLKKIKDPKAQQLAADIVAFNNSKLRCGQTMVIKFSTS
jgi:hypothetical protein